MADNFYGEFGLPERPKKTTKPMMEPSSSFVERCPDWPDVPGKTQSRNRSNGIKKIQQYPKSKGL